MTWKLTIRPEWNCEQSSEHATKAEALGAVQSWCDTRDRFGFTSECNPWIDTLGGKLTDHAVPQQASIRTDGGRNCGRWFATQRS